MALAFSYSMAEYAYPVWERSMHISKLDPALNKACRSITGCLRHLLRMYISLLVLHQLVSEGLPHLYKNMQTEDPRHSLYSHEPVNKRLKSRNSFVHSVTPQKLKSTPSEALYIYIYVYFILTWYTVIL